MSLDLNTVWKSCDELNTCSSNCKQALILWWSEMQMLQPPDSSAHNSLTTWRWGRWPGKIDISNSVADYTGASSEYNWLGNPVVKICSSQTTQTSLNIGEFQTSIIKTLISFSFHGCNDLSKLGLHGYNVLCRESPRHARVANDMRCKANTAYL